MSENSTIEWTDHTHNDWIGCTRVSSGCDNCYAAVSTPSRALRIVWGPGESRHRTAASTRDNPRKWNARHDAFIAAHGRRQRVFCASLSDWADNEVSIKWFIDLLELVRMTPNLDWLMLTKRIGNVMKRLQAASDWIQINANEAFSAVQTWIDRWIGGEPPTNIWLGATIVNQEEADRDIEKLLMTPARRRFLSMEPLLGPIDLQPWLDPTGGCCMREMESCEDCPAAADWIHGPTTVYADDGSGYLSPRIDEVFAGGESGRGARPMHTEWVRSLRDQCAVAGVSFLFKQWGEWVPTDDAPGVDMGGEIEQDRVRIVKPDGSYDARFRQGDVTMRRVGKKAAGRVLDGCIHNGSLDQQPVRA
jgi:protein gp37